MLLTTNFGEAVRRNHGEVEVGAELFAFLAFSALSRNHPNATFFADHHSLKTGAGVRRLSLDLVIWLLQRSVKLRGQLWKPNISASWCDQPEIGTGLGKLIDMADLDRSDGGDDASLREEDRPFHAAPEDVDERRVLFAAIDSFQ